MRVRDLLRAAEAAGVGRFVYVGVSVLAERGRSDAADAEREAEARCAVARVPTLVLRASLVVGPGDGHVSRMARKARARWPVLVFVGQGWAKSAPMTAADFAECVVSALLSDEFPPRARVRGGKEDAEKAPPDAAPRDSAELDVAGPELLTAMDIQDRLLARFGRRKLKLHVPASVALAGAWLMEKAMRRPPVTRSRLAWLLDDLAPKRNSARRLLGRRPEPFETAF
jgi:uncharacterized protein YbjT (DUF2867 family)